MRPTRRGIKTTVRPAQIPIGTQRELEIMETIYTLQEFMLQTKNIIYPLIVVALLAMLGFWRFLNDRDDD